MRLIFAIVAVLMCTSSSWALGDDPDFRIEFRQFSAPSIVLIQMGKHDFKEPLRIPVQSENPILDIPLQGGSNLIPVVKRTMEVTDVGGVKSYASLLSVASDLTKPTNLNYEVRHTLSKIPAVLFDESYFINLDQKETTLKRVFNVVNTSGVQWGAGNNQVQIVLIDEQRGVLLDRKVASVPSGASLRLEQIVDCKVESGVVWISPSQVKQGDVFQTLKLQNGATGGKKSIRTVLPQGKFLEMRRKNDDPRRPLRPVSFANSIPIGTPESLLESPCGYSSDTAPNTAVLNVGTYFDVHVLKVSDGPKRPLFPVAVTDTDLVYVSGLSRSIQVHNRSGEKVTFGVLQEVNNTSISVSKFDHKIEVDSGQTVDLSDSTISDLKIISVPTDRVARTDAQKYRELAKDLAANVEKYIQASNVEYMRRIYCTHPATRERVQKLKPEEFRVFLDKLLEDVKKSSDSLVTAANLEKELLEAQESKATLLLLLKDTAGLDTEAYAKDRIRIQGQIESLEVVIGRLESDLIVQQARSNWHMSPVSSRFKNKHWEVNK